MVSEVGIPRVRELTTDVLIIGSGVAGSYAALTAASLGAQVVVATKTSLLSGSTRWAQGGIAFPVDADDIASHLHDTAIAGRGLVDENLTEELLAESLEHFEYLTTAGLFFDPDPGLEGGHSRPRVRHMGGDESGLRLLQFLHQRLPTQVRCLEHHFCSGLLFSGSTVQGAEFWYGDEPGQVLHVGASKTILATGGAGQLYEVTTNPVESTGDGIALAYRGGALLRDIELVQFHPTVLGDGALVSEACRGAGAKLLDSSGKRFMHHYDDAGELAPRDVVARAIVTEMEKGAHVYLDLRSIKSFQERFPTVFSSAKRAGFDPLIQPIPVRPAAHYLMGGVSTDETGQSSIVNLFAAGEVASTGLHGANRLASNSLLEGLVMGARAAIAAVKGIQSPPQVAMESRDIVGLDPSCRDEIRSQLTQGAFVVRDGERIKEALRVLGEMSPHVTNSRSEAETFNLREVGFLLLRGALLREESRGAHFRSDFPTTGESGFHVDQDLSGARLNPTN